MWKKQRSKYILRMMLNSLSIFKGLSSDTLESIESRIYEDYEKWHKEKVEENHEDCN